MRTFVFQREIFVFEATYDDPHAIDLKTREIFFGNVAGMYNLSEITFPQRNLQWRSLPAIEVFASIVKLNIIQNTNLSDTDSEIEK